MEIPARQWLAPYQQGKLDGLCGPYAVINSMRLALAEAQLLPMAMSKQLLARGFALLRRRGLLEGALSEGMDIPIVGAIAQDCARWLSKRGFAVAVEKPKRHAIPTWEAAQRWIETSLAQGKPVIVTFEGGLEHYSVISAATVTRFYLFDSAGLSFVRRVKCGFSSTYHTIPPNGLFRIACQPEG